MSGGYSISTRWDGTPLPASEAVDFTLTLGDSCLRISFSAPFYNNPASPAAPPGPCQQLWDYEVFEIFFLGVNDRYVEVEVCPHGQHLVLLLDGVRKPFVDMLPLAYTYSVRDGKWTGHFDIPFAYFPPETSRVCKIIVVDTFTDLHHSR